MGEPPPCKKPPPPPQLQRAFRHMVFLGEWLNRGARGGEEGGVCLPPACRGGKRLTPSQPTPEHVSVHMHHPPIPGKLWGSRFPAGAAPMPAAAWGEPSCSLAY